MSSAPPTPDPGAATRHPLRTAAAAVVCLVVAEWWGLKHANQAVWTTYMVMVQHPFTAFQKGLERVLGRGAGILAGLIVTTVLPDASLLALAVIGVFLIPCFYLYFSGRLAYTFLNTGLYAVVMLEIGNADLPAAVRAGEELFLAILLGVVVASGVSWLAGAESDLRIQVGDAPLWPLRGDWLSHSLMLVATVALTLFAAHRLGLPAEPAAISVLILTVTPDIQSLLHKGKLRIAGALLATLWSIGMFLVLGFLPYFTLLAGMLFLGMFAAGYLARTGGDSSYAGVQMGLVLAMVVVAPRAEFGSVASAVVRIEGVLIALAASLVVGGLWPRVQR